ncbi:MAG: hypothetical protein FJ030_01585 [Chloroflexi bacterium]|nr:hypothetical protein [Chloroflexota bacterium]
MTAKLLMSWDIKPGEEQEYFEFIVREFVPGITKLGIQPTEAWYTVYGNCPQILTAGVAENADSIRKALASEEWQALQEKLESFVDHLEKKVIRAGGGFQL